MSTDSVRQVFTWSATTGQMITATEGGTETEKVLFPSGSLKTERFTRDNTTREAGYTRTLSGRVNSYTDVAGKTMRYMRDGTGRVTRITDDALTVSLTYSPLGTLSQQVVTDVKTQATLTTALTYDDFGRETGRTLTDSSGTVIVMLQTWLKNDLLATRITHKEGVLMREEAFTYDACNRLTGYTVRGGSLPVEAYGHQIRSQTYSYDMLNNLTTVVTLLNDSTGSIDIATYHYDNADDPTQLTSLTHTLTGAYPADIVLEYDADGRMTKDASGRTRGYDAMGRLVSIRGNGLSDATYGYDALNRLVSQTVSATDVRQLYYRADELVNEVLTQQQNEKTTRWVKNGHTCLGISDGNSMTLMAGDQHDSLQWSRDTTQQAGVQHAWSPYGGGETADGLPGFNGERADPVTGNTPLGNGYRTYSPALMRFTCPDSLSPFGAGGINAYAYCAGDPVNHTDPSGHLSWQAWVGIGVGTVGLVLAVFTAGASIAAAGGVIAAIEGASAVTLAAGGLGVVADVTGIASGVVEESHPEASKTLGWVSMATGVGALGAGIIGVMKAGRGVARGLAEGGEALELQPRVRSTTQVSAMGSAEQVVRAGIQDLPEEMIREIGRHLPLEDLKNLRAVSWFREAITAGDLARIRSVESYQFAPNWYENIIGVDVLSTGPQLVRLDSYTGHSGCNFATRIAFNTLESNFRYDEYTNRAFSGNFDGLVDCVRWVNRHGNNMVEGQINIYHVLGGYDRM